MERARRIPLIAAAVLMPFAASAAPDVAIPAASHPERFYVPAEGFGAIVNETLGSFRAKDAFETTQACSIVDAVTLRAYTMPEALKLLGPCLKRLSSRYGASLEAEAGVLGPAPTGEAVNGILIRVTGQISAESPVLRDLHHALHKRNNRLLGFPAKVDRDGAFRTQSEEEAQGRSAVQDTLDRCILPTVVRPIRSGADFVKHYGSCILKDKVLKIRELRASSGHKLAVTLHCEAERPGMENMNGYVTVHGEYGPVSILIIAYPLEIALP